MKQFISLFCVMLLALGAAAQKPFEFAHGPYLQEVTTDGATLVFLTSAKAFAWVELKAKGANAVPERYYNATNGLRDANTIFHSVRVEGLKPGTSYEYRLMSKEMRSFQPYKVTFGDSIASQWYSFSTVDPKQKGASFFVTSDIHSDASKLERLLNLCDYKTCDAFFYVGDMMNYMDTEEAPFKSFIDTSVKLFATSTPFELVRGNHETRGDMARVFPSLFPKKDGKIYGSYRLGDIMVVMVDCGEDKPDSHWVYAGLTDFDRYRSEQAEWLKKLVKSKEYKEAKYRIVMTHFPLVIEGEEYKQDVGHGLKDLRSKFLPILKHANVDLMVSGHTHRFAFHNPGVGECDFPVLVGSADSAARIDVENGKIRIKAVDSKGKVLLETLLPAGK